MNIEPKVAAATWGAVLSALLVWVLETYAFHGSLPDPVNAAVQTLIPGIVAFVSGWLAQHVDRPAPTPATTEPKGTPAP